MPSHFRPEIVTAYFLCHGLWTVIPRQLQENFADMADCGFNAVAISFSESEMTYARRAFELQVRLAHAAGLRVFVVPSRIGGRLAGAPLMPSPWLCTHPEAQAGNPWLPLACVEHEPFRQWARDFMTTLVTDYPIDGIVWDEPKATDYVTRHPDAAAKYGPDPTREQMMDGFVDWLTDLTGHCLRLRPSLVVTLFLQHTDPDYFTRRAAAIPGIACFGYDGNLARQSTFHEAPAWHKYRIETTWPRTQAEAAAAGKKTFSLVENMLMPAEAIPEYEANLESYLAGPLPDHLGLYYYAHNNEDPDRTHAVTRRLMRRRLVANNA